MIQFNLLPDVKQEYVKARRTKRMVTLISLAVSAISLFILVLSFVTVDVVQKVTIRNLDKDITSSSNELKSIKNLNKILTVQNQLNSLPGLYDKDPVTSRLFGYLSQITPNGVTISSLSLDYAAGTFQLSGAAPNLEAVNGFADTLKSTKYVTYTADAAGQKQQADDQDYFKANGKYKNTTGAKPAFSNVVLSSFGKTDSGVSYSVSMGFDGTIFANTNYTTLEVPTDTISNTSILFKQAEE